MTAALLAALSVLLLLGRPRDRRLVRALGAPPSASGGAPPRPALRHGPRRPQEREPRRPGAAASGAGAGVPRPSPAVAACLLAGVAAAALAPGPLGITMGVAVAVAGPRLLSRLETEAARDARQQLVRDLPLLLDLLASCLAGGAPLPDAARAVAAAVPGPAGQRLAAVAAALAVGSPPADAWGALAAGERDDPLAPAARALARAADGGAPVAAAVSRLAADARADARSRGEQAARRVGVLAVAPLGLCFLPAFVLLGVVPVVVGLAGPLLASF